MKRHLLALAGLLAASASCGTGDPAIPGGFRLKGTVLSRNEGAPLPSALVVVELGDIYVKNPDPTKFAPAYVIGTMTNERGEFDVDVPDDVENGQVGIHTFSDGYRYGSLKFKLRDGNALVTTRRHFLVPPGQDPATATDAEFEPTATDFLVASGGAPGKEITVAPGAPLEFSVVVKAGSGPLAEQHDVMSDEVLVVQPDLSWAGAMTPPPEGCATTGCVQGKGFPDGKWTRAVAAPTKPGKYTYYSVTTSEKCVTSRRLTVSVTVQ